MDRVLVVCEGNICRSPYVEHLLRVTLERHGVSGVQVESAGTRARTGLGMVERSAAALRAAAIDVGAFRSRALRDVPALAAVDLVLTLERRHRAAVLDLEPSLLKRTFTLVEFARTAIERPGAAALSGRTALPLAVLVDAVRSARRAGPTPNSDDVPDPIRGDDADHERFRAQVAEPVATVARLLGTHRTVQP